MYYNRLKYTGLKSSVGFLLLVLYLVVMSSSCKDETDIKDADELALESLNLPDEPANYSSPFLPSFFYNQFVTIQDNTPSDNPTTDWGATLGRVLFYDKMLSINNTVSCASCHQQEFGFIDTARFSKGFDGELTRRHSMALANSAYYINGRFFWDERAASLEEQVLEPIEDKIEMGMTLPAVIERLNAVDYYPVLFKKAFNDEEITEDRIAKALAQFVRSMVSYTSKYDMGRALVNDRKTPFPNFTNAENRGKNIFMTHRTVNCFGCHNTDVFITDHPRNNGLAVDDQDEGIYIHTLNNRDKGKFKTPSLKNVAVRGRFMHDGSLSSLEEVIEHYNSGIQAHPNLDSHLIDVSTGIPVQMNLTPQDKADIIAFLHTLTDHDLLTDEKFSNPF